MRGIERRLLLAGSGALLASPALVHAQGTNGVALVIGNSKYQWEAALPNAARDATDIARRLQEMGLKTELVRDAGREAMKRALDKFSTASRGARLAAFYFAGHGAEWQGVPYLVPVDEDLSNPESVKEFTPAISFFGPTKEPALFELTKEASHRLLIFDNCRNNPADGWRQKETAEYAAGSEKGHAMFAGQQPDTIFLFSTAPGRVALDGPAGQNSPFATALLRHLGGGTDLPMLPEKVRRDLLIATHGRQLATSFGSFAQSLVLELPRGGRPIGTPAPVGDPSSIVELTNAYAFARQRGLNLLPGLIAYRPLGNSPDAAKVGAYRFEWKSGSLGIIPSLLIVMRGAEANATDVILGGESTPSWGPTGD